MLRLVPQGSSKTRGRLVETKAKANRDQEQDFLPIWIVTQLNKPKKNQADLGELRRSESSEVCSYLSSRLVFSQTACHFHLQLDNRKHTLFSVIAKSCNKL